MAFASVDEQLKILSRGAAEILSVEELKKKLEKSYMENRPLKVKFGADPTAPDIHLGHTVPLRKLRQFQDLGHEVIFLIGDFTGMIGDPTGKSETRKALSKEQVLQNAETYKTQIFKILDKEKTRIVFNSEWCAPLKFEDVLALTAQCTVAQMLERDDFSKRYKGGQAISILEFMYPLIQGYDSVALEADVEIGGTDQKFNLLMGRQLQKGAEQEAQVVLMMPIIEGTDGVKKMSKSLGNYIGIEDTPRDMLGKIMTIPDEMISRYFELLTDVPLSTVEGYMEKMKAGENPRNYKMLLGKEIVHQYYGEEEADLAEEEFNRMFQKKGLPDEMPELKLTEEKSLVDIIADAGILPSKGEMRRMIKQNAVSIDGEKITDDLMIAPGKECIIKIGKRKFLKLLS